MEHIAPLIQTLLWVALIGGLVYHFNQPIHGLLIAVQKRVESGSNIKAGPFELSEQVRPQGLGEQVQKAQAEVLELVHAEAAESPNLTPRPVAQTTSLFLEAEDLALRAIQLEYGQPVSRQVSIGPALLVDGAFTINGQLNIVEVKHFVRFKNAEANLRRTLQTFADLLRNVHFRRVNIVLAVVFHHASDIPEARKQLAILAGEYPMSIDVRCYALDELRRQFGLSN